MSDIKNIENFALNEFSCLTDSYGFQGPRIVQEEAITRIAYLKENIGIEIELDWRDFIAFVLVVKLENGEMPNGYYISNGMKCRKHLANVIREQKWSAPPGPKFDQSSKPATVEDFKCILSIYKKQLIACIKNLQVHSHTIFFQHSDLKQKPTLSNLAL